MTSKLIFLVRGSALVIGIALIAWVVGRYVANEGASALIRPKSPEQFAAEKANLPRVLEAASRVTLAEIPDSDAAGLCGPAALYVMMAAAGRLGPNISFARYVSDLQQAHVLHSTFNGMSAGQVQSALERQGLAADVYRAAIGQSEANDIVQALDEGRAVFVFVRAAESFQALTGRPFPSRDAEHIIAPLAVDRDPTGKPVSVRWYDVNALNGQPLPQIEGIGLTAVPYETFVSMLGGRVMTVLPFIRPVSAYVISRQRVSS